MLVAAARQAMMTDQERARGSLIVRWSLATAMSPCADVEENLKII
jgi:hypothetical protein